MNPKLIIEQNIKFMVNQYRIYDTNEDGTKNVLIAFAQQKRLAFKEKISFYTDDAKTTLVFTLRAEKVMDIHGHYFVETAEGGLIGAFRKDFTKSLASSTWHIVDTTDAPLVTFTESNLTLAALRRYAGYIPIIGEFIDIFLAFFKYHFDLVDRSGMKVGQYRKTTLLRDKYELLCSDDAYAGQDWRVLVAVCVALDALQSR